MWHAHASFVAYQQPYCNSGNFQFLYSMAYAKLNANKLCKLLMLMQYGVVSQKII